MLVAIDFHSIFFPAMEVNGSHQLFDYQHSSKYLLLCSKEEEKKNSYRSYPFNGYWWSSTGNIDIAIDNWRQGFAPCCQFLLQ